MAKSKMIVRQQGTSECALVTLAAISGTDLDVIRWKACEKAGVLYWSEAAGAMFWDSLRDVAIELDLGGMVVGWANALVRSRSGTPASSIMKLPAKGRGSVLIRPKSNKGNSHVMPYADGLVYDPNNPDLGMPLERMMTLCYPNHKLVSVDPLVRDSRSVPCPECGAEAGRPCKYPSGYVYAKGHKSRRG